VLQKERTNHKNGRLVDLILLFVVVSMAAVYGSQSSIPNYYNDAPDRPLFGESRPRVSKREYFHFFVTFTLPSVILYSGNDEM